MPTADLRHGDCLDILKQLPDESVHAVITDPPYGLANTDSGHVVETLSRWFAGERDYLPSGAGFMGKAWDAFVPPPAVWDECMRVLKPGGHLLAFAGTRTVDLMGLSIRLAGFDLRDSITWLMGSGFPKSLNVSKDKRFCQCGPVESTRATTTEAEHDVCDVRGVDVPATRRAGGRSGTVLLAGVPEQGAPHDGRETGTALRGGQPSLEGRGDVQAPEGQLHRATLREVSSGVPADGAGGWVHHGASAGDGSVGGPDAHADGVRESHQPRPSGQPSGELGAVPDERGSQAGGGWPVCGRCGEPVVPPGLGTALKPASEPVVVARKPLTGTVAANVLAHGTGALNIDATRVAGESWSRPGGASAGKSGGIMGATVARDPSKSNPAGRWPSNVVLSHASTPDGDDACVGACVEGCPAAALDTDSGERPAGRPQNRFTSGDKFGGTPYGDGLKQRTGWNTSPGYTDSGGASRFFPVFKYQAKAPTKERPSYIDEHGVKQAHNTVKPLELMRWLVRLVTPPGGTVLEPFAGSGTTVEAALLEGFDVIAIEREADYLPLIQQRIDRATASTTPTPEAEMEGLW